MRKSFFGIILLVFIVMSKSSNASTGIYIPDVHRHGITNHPFFKSWMHPYKFQMVKTLLPEGNIDEIVASPNKKWQAYIMCVPQENPNYGCLGKVYVKDNSGSVYEIQSEIINPLRVFNNVVWATDDIIVFDQWTHWGFHVAIDVANQQLLQDLIVLPTTPTPVSILDP